MLLGRLVPAWLQISSAWASCSHPQAANRGPGVLGSSGWEWEEPGFVQHSSPAAGNTCTWKHILLRNAASRWIWKSLPAWIACPTFYTKCIVKQAEIGTISFFLFFVKLLSGCRSPWLILDFLYCPNYFHMQSFYSASVRWLPYRMLDVCVVLLEAVFPWAVLCIPPGTCSGNIMPRTPWVSLIYLAKKEREEKVMIWYKNQTSKQYWSAL